MYLVSSDYTQACTKMQMYTMDVIQIEMSNITHEEASEVIFNFVWYHFWCGWNSHRQELNNFVYK